MDRAFLIVLSKVIGLRFFHTQVWNKYIMLVYISVILC